MLSTYSRLDPVIRVIQSYSNLVRTRPFPPVDKKAEAWRDCSTCPTAHRQQEITPGVRAAALRQEIVDVFVCVPISVTADLTSHLKWVSSSLRCWSSSYQLVIWLMERVLN